MTLEDTEAPTGEPSETGPAPRGLLSRFIGPASRDGLVMRLLRESVKEHRVTYAFAILAMIIVAASTAGTAWIMGAIVDSMADEENRSLVFWVAGGVLVIFVVKGVSSFTQLVLMARAGNRIVAQKQSQLFRKLLKQSVGYFNVTESSDLLIRVTHSAQMARNVVDIVVTSFVRDLLTLIGLIGVMFYQQPLLSLVCLVVGPAALYAVRKILTNVKEIMAQEMAGLTDIIRVVQEASTGARVVKAFGLEPRMTVQMDAAVKKVEKRANKIVTLEAATTPLMDSITGLAIASIVILSAVNVFGREAGSAGQLMSFVTAFLMAYEPAKRLSRMRVSIEAGLVGVRMMYEVLDQPVSMTEADAAIDLPDGPGAVKLADIEFGYGENTPVIRDVSIDFPAGKTTALVGPSGGGKSTLLNLILRLYDPQSGLVTIDGEDIRNATFSSLRNKIAFVGQDTFLFATTIMDNILLARPEATEEEVIEAAKIAHAHEFIEQLEFGYDTPVGENGTFLSGGQKQRIAIARAVLRRSPILLLDEATSALDSHSEALVRDALARITEGVTTIVIAHRLSTVLNADQICYLEDGQVAESGRIQDLLAKKDGKFRNLFDEQFGAADQFSQITATD